MIAPQASATVGGTPLVWLARIGKDLDAEVCGKLEYFNPGGSVKDRIGAAMIGAAEAKGLIERGQSTIVEPTSGNTGIALAMICAARDYRLVLTMPEGMSRERGKLLRAYGAEVVESPSMGGMDESVALATRIAEERDAFMPQQFSNPANPEAHFRTTGPEIWTDTHGEVSVFVCGVGTGGTITGVARYLKEQDSDARIIAVEPASSPVLSGGKPGPHRIQGIGAGFVPDVLEVDLIDEYLPVRDEDAIETAHRLAREEGILCGISAGANVHAALEVASRPEYAGGRVVTVVCDSGDRYMSLPFFVGMSGAPPTRIRSLLAEQVEAARGRDPATAGASTAEILLTWPGVQAVLAYRLANRLKRSRIPLLPLAVSWLARSVTGIEIHPGARIGSGFFIDHGAGVVVGETTEVGDDVTIYQGVTLGGTGFQAGKRHPTIEDNVTIGSGAKLLGPITVGHGAKIGANSVVVEDVPPCSTVVGNPGHPVKVEGRRVEGPDADWIHLPDPLQDAVKTLSARIKELERQVAELSGQEDPQNGDPDPAPKKGRSSAGG